MDKQKLINEWRKQDPEFEDLDGFAKFIEDRTPINTIEFTKPYSVLKTIRHLSKVGSISLILHSEGFNVYVNGLCTDSFSVPIPIKHIPAYECNQGLHIPEFLSTKLLTMLFENMKHTQCITVETTAKSINIYAEYGDGSSDFSYIIDLPAQVHHRLTCN